MTDEPRTFEDLFADLSEQLGEIETAEVDRGTEYRRRGVVFAAVEAKTVAELRLNIEVADAARRTPSTGVSARGAEWVRFAPGQLDRPVLDRAEAWFMSAWRAAAARL